MTILAQLYYLEFGTTQFLILGCEIGPIIGFQSDLGLDKNSTFTNLKEPH
jgi:hypothetical protein